MTTAANPNRPAAGAPRPYQFPSFDRRRLANGLTIWMVPLPGATVTSVHLLLDAGAAAEDEEHGGVAALTAHLLVTGTRRLDAAAFAEATERLGIEVSSESSWDQARAAFQSLPEQLEAGLELLAEMVLEPRFDAGEFARLKSERLNDILQTRSEPGPLAEEMFLDHLFSPASPYHRVSGGTPETVESLSLDDVRAHHAAAWRPSAAHLIVAGSFDSEAVMRAAQLRLGSWSGTAPGHRTFTTAPRGGRRVIIVDRPGSVQSEIRIGHVGIPRSDARYFPAMILGAMLGGVFGSRLNLRLREELGYTYGASARFDARRAAGPFVAAAAVQTEVSADAVREMLGQLETVHAAEPSMSELLSVRDFLVGIFPLRFETTGGVAAAIEPLAVYGLADEYWQTYRAQLEAVEPPDVHRVAGELVRPDDFLILVVGDADVIRAEIESAGFAATEVVAAP